MSNYVNLVVGIKKMLDEPNKKRAHILVCLCECLKILPFCCKYQCFFMAAMAKIAMSFEAKACQLQRSIEILPMNIKPHG